MRFLSMVVLIAMFSLSAGPPVVIQNDDDNEQLVFQFDPLPAACVKTQDLEPKYPIWKEERFAIAVAQHESKLCPSGYNAREDAVGAFQIRPCVVQDLNSWGYKFTLEDRRDMNKSRKMMEIYLDHYCREYQKNAPNSSSEVSITIAGSIWNGGPYGYLKWDCINYGETIVDLYNQG